MHYMRLANRLMAHERSEKNCSIRRRCSLASTSSSNWTNKEPCTVSSRGSTAIRSIKPTSLVTRRLPDGFSSDLVSLAQLGIRCGSRPLSSENSRVGASSSRGAVFKLTCMLTWLLFRSKSSRWRMSFSNASTLFEKRILMPSAAR
jgi:hypothetical protein